MTRRIVITGSDGFVGKNLRLRLRETGFADVVSVVRATRTDELRRALAGADFVYHLAGANRPADPAHFVRDNRDFTATLSSILAETGRTTPIAYTSSTQAALDNPYGRSKLAAERIVEGYGTLTGAATFILRLTNVFGKWSRPNYNSVVATFCHSLVHGIPLSVHDPDAPMSLLYIDDVVTSLVALLGDAPVAPGFIDVGPIYQATVGEVAKTLRAFACSRQTLVVPPVGAGLTRALYATYLSYVPASDFAYSVKQRVDPRGSFVEVLKTETSGQISYFTARPGVTRGEHYHHSKTEKFLVVKGMARFGFRNIVTNEIHEVTVDGGVPQIVETVPGWAHSITNVGDDDMIAILWANEVFDPEWPDTIASKVAG